MGAAGGRIGRGGVGVEKMRAKTRSQSADVDKIAGIEKIRVDTTGNIGFDSDI